ncbi:MAG: carbohydrate binding domain-containing protein [Clostridia bacterium]|nr:carbohydrate binding domain-containing protein [Clostridia bacterium]
MKQLFKNRIWIVAICVAAMLATSVLGAFALKQPEQNQAASEKTQPMKLYEQIIEEDGFLFGINYPWLEIGHTLTTNELMVKCDVRPSGDPNSIALDTWGDEAIYEGLYNLRALGYRTIAYWGSVHGEGVIYGDHGEVLGVKEEYLANIDRFLNLCERADMTVMWIVSAHSDSIVELGEGGKHLWDIVSQSIVNPEVTEQYIENFVRPVMRVLGKHPKSVALISAGSEAENEINDDNIGDHFSGDRAFYGTTMEKMKHFLTRITETAEEEVPNIGRTMVCNASYLNIYNDVNLDAVGINRYASSASVDTIETFRTSHPMFVTEWGLGKFASEEAFTINTTRMFEDILNKGYLGSFFWCYQPDGRGGEFGTLKEGSATQSDFRDFMYTMSFVMRDFANEHRGVECYLDAPVMFYNRGSGMVEWMGSRQASTIDIQRSLDGGKTWTTLVENAPVEQYQDGYKGTYEDETLPTEGQVTYRVIARDGEDTAASAPANVVAIMAPAPELMTNGGFENGLEGWEQPWSDTIDVSDKFAYEGNYSLYLNGKAWSGVVQENIPVTAGKRYRLSVTYRTASTEVNNGFIWVRWGASGGTRYSPEQISAGYFNTTEPGWHTLEAVFVVPADLEIPEICVDLRLDDPAAYGGREGMFYIDEVSLKEVR